MGEYRRFFREVGGVEVFVAFVLAWSTQALLSSVIYLVLFPLSEWLRIKLALHSAAVLNFKGDGVTFYVQRFSFAENLISLLVLWFLLLALVVRPANRRRGGLRACPECLGDMPAAARRCWHCGVQVTEITADA